MSEIFERFTDQILTTIETIRRRAISYYDAIFYVGNQLQKAGERLTEIAEPAAYDARDFVNQSLEDSTPLNTIDAETKNSLVELYLGIAVLLIGLCGGQISGVHAFTFIIPKIFDTYVVLLILIALPFYVYINIRKNISLDECQRRTTFYSTVMFFGLFCGYLVGPKILSMAPATMFLPPFLFALMFDNDLLITPLPNLDRTTFFISFASISVFVSTLIAAFTTGYFSFAVSLLNIIHVSGLFVHFQIMMQFSKTKSLNVADSQFAYMAVLIIIQLIFAAVFGYDYQKL